MVKGARILGVLVSIGVLTCGFSSLSIHPIAQTTGSVEIIIGKNVRVSQESSSFIEASVAAHPDDPNILVISSSEIIREGMIATSFFSTDGGRTWKHSQLPEMKEGLNRQDFSHSEDTWTAFAPTGAMYLSALVPKKVGEDRYEAGIWVYRSSDNGRTWKGPARLAGRHFDRPAIVATSDHVYIESNASGRDAAIVSQPFSGDIIALLRSDDGANSFKTASYVVPDNLGHHSTNPIVLPDGSLLLAFNDHPRGTSPLTSSRFYVVQATNKGERLGLPEFVCDVDRPSVPGNVAVDNSTSQFRGRVYAVWESGTLMYLNGENAKSEALSGKTREPSVAYSTNSGLSWSSPVTFHSENAGPAYYTTIAVNRNGVVGVAWLQHETRSIERLCYRIYFAASIDGGKTFTPPRVVSDAVSCPDGSENLAVIFPPDNHHVTEIWPRGGDYIGLAVTADGDFHPVWIDGRDGPFQAYTSRVKVIVSETH